MNDDDSVARDLEILGLHRMPQTHKTLLLAYSDAERRERGYFSRDNPLPSAMKAAYQRLQAKIPEQRPDFMQGFKTR